MSDLQRVGDLEVAQDMRKERRAYRARMVAAGVFALLLLLGLLGVLGRSGPLSDTTSRAGAMSVEYQRFLRVKSPTELRVRLARGTGDTNVAISRDLLDDHRIEGYGVEPQDATALPDRVVFTFAQRAPAEVTFHLEPQRIGRLAGVVHGPGGARVSIEQWVWP